MNPADGERYTISGDHCWGKWSMIAACKYYKIGSNKRQIRTGYRWVVDSGDVIHKKDVESFVLA